MKRKEEDGAILEGSLEVLSGVIHFGESLNRARVQEGRCLFSAVRGRFMGFTERKHPEAAHLWWPLPWHGRCRRHAVGGEGGGGAARKAVMTHSQRGAMQRENVHVSQSHVAPPI